MVHCCKGGIFAARPGSLFRQRKPAVVLGMRDACAALVAALGMPFAASAQSALILPALPPQVPFASSLSGDWTVMVGAGGELKPDFEGAKRYMLSPVPVFSIHRAGSPDRFHSPRDNPGIALVDFNGFFAGPVGKFVAARTAANDGALAGLGDVNAAFEFGAFAEYFPVDWFRARAEVRQGFGGHHGVVADFSGDFIVPVSQRWTFSGGPRLTVEDNNATAPYFSITPAQALASGLPAFNAKGGLHSTGAGVQARYQITPKWEVHSYVEYQHLMGGAAASPLVKLRGSPDSATVGIGVSYSFDFRVR
jgi:outer membrane protein